MALALEIGGSDVTDNKVGDINSATVHLLHALFNPPRKNTSNTYVSMVPYGAAVNIGINNANWTSNPLNVSFPANGPWAGCVMAIDTYTTPDTDDPPSLSQQWPVYFAQSTMGMVGTNPGDNDWGLDKKSNIVV